MLLWKKVTVLLGFGSKPRKEFQEQLMRLTAAILVSVLLLAPQFTGATEVSGDQSGVWRPENNPYEVVGEIRVPPGATLLIEPGVLVKFRGYYKFIVDSTAVLRSIGTYNDSIYFTTDDTATGWHGIRFLCADETCQLSYCVIEYGKAEGVSPDNRGGGVYCSHSSITITHCTFRYNFASTSGGGISLCDSSHATVTDNHFIANTAWWGAGMRCMLSSLANVSLNVFSGNYSHDTAGGLSCVSKSDALVFSNVFKDNTARFGGGINIRFSAPTVAGNLFRNNLAEFGGGLNCRYSRAIIENNIFRSNSADQGGGIYSGRSGPVIRDNVINNNSADQGGGIYFGNSVPYVEGNTIAFNSAGERGGGFYWRASSDSAITNTILWGNQSPVGPEIYVDGESPGITYCDVQGGWPGQGNINADPMFVGPERGDYHLRWHSPCIDAGDPNFPLDPDDTRSDIGAFYFDQDLHGIVELYPHEAPIVIPPEGGDIIYDGWVFNFSGQSHQSDIWTYLFVPSGQQYGPLELHENIRIPLDSLGRKQRTENIPGAAPEGDYVFVAYVGDYPGSIIDSSYFYFSKDSLLVGVGSDGTGGGLPLSCVLSQNYPNPFNLSTTIYYQLPANGYVKLEVYNLLGQKVAILADESQQDGYRSVTWEASEVSSGLYFYKLTAGDFTETKRMMLVK